MPGCVTMATRPRRRSDVLGEQGARARSDDDQVGVASGPDLDDEEITVAAG